MPATGQRIVAALLLIAVSPLLVVLAVAVRLTSRGPALHRAKRVGAGGTFTLYKFRTMRDGAGLGITASGDPRITRLGQALRRTKLDELPQLWNVVRGEMLLVGPRPEDPHYVDWSDPLHREVFGAKPGITGATAVAYRNEERTLAVEARRIAAERGGPTTDDDVDRAYREVILPRKLAMDAEYLRTRTARGDLVILGRTISQVLRRNGGP
jgi:lipopolysaccharide/colanic/teichoic acid biosynthesis glycosyltransferase